MAYIYQIKNIITQDTYIGKTIKTPEERFMRHIYNSRYGQNTHLCRAIRKYGESNFNISTIEEVDETLLNEREQFHIKNNKPQYNMTEGGDGGNTIMSITEDFKKKMSELTKGSNNPMYGKKGKDNPNYGKKYGKNPLISQKLKNPCMCEGKFFPSIGEAESFYYGKHSVRKRLDNPKYPDWYRLSPKIKRK
jgi:group I intron endonuclease